MIGDHIDYMGFTSMMKFIGLKLYGRAWGKIEGAYRNYAGIGRGTRLLIWACRKRYEVKLQFGVFSEKLIESVNKKCSPCTLSVNDSDELGEQLQLLENMVSILTSYYWTYLLSILTSYYWTYLLRDLCGMKEAW